MYNTYRLFSIQDWDHFSTTAASVTIKHTQSLEAIHNTIHIYVGGTGPMGHMSANDYAGESSSRQTFSITSLQYFK